MAQHTPKFAGSFYTPEPIPLNRNVRLLLTGGRTGLTLTDARPLAIVSPHAGYRFSGHLMGEAYAAALTGSMKHEYKRIVILSPSHKHRFDGLALPTWRMMSVPNGRVKVDRLCSNDLIDRKMAQIEDAAFENEHGIETQIPFIARYFREAAVVPLVVGRMKVPALSRVIDHLASDPEVPTLFVLSSDLSHFHDEAHAARLDAATAQMIETGDTRGLDGVHACGWMPLLGFLNSQTGSGAKAMRLGMANSARVTQDTTRVVGYGAWAMYSAQANVFNAKRREMLLKAARSGLQIHLRNGKTPAINLDSFGAPLHTTLASFVTLSDKGRLRGCIGSLVPHQPLVRDVVANAIKAATQDHRFKPLTHPKQLEGLDLKIAVLTRAAPLSFSDRSDLERLVRPGVTGLILEDRGKRGTFLPMVWDSLQTPKAFIDGLVVKAGLPKGHWSDSVKIWQFQAESFSDANRHESAKKP